MTSDSLRDPSARFASLRMTARAPPALCIFEHFFDRGVSFEDAAQAILTQRHHPEFDRFLFQDDGGRSLVDQFADCVVDFHQLVDAFAALVAGLIAGVAPFAVVKILLAYVAPRELELTEIGL